MSDSYKSGFENGYMQAFRDFEKQEEKNRKEFEQKAKDKAEMHGLKTGFFGFFFAAFILFVLWNFGQFLYESLERHFLHRAMQTERREK